MLANARRARPKRCAGSVVVSAAALRTLGVREFVRVAPLRPLWKREKKPRPSALRSQFHLTTFTPFVSRSGRWVFRERSALQRAPSLRIYSVRPPQHRSCRATARISVQGLPTADARKPVGKFAVRRHHPPHSVEKPERRLPDALDASCSGTCVPYLHLLGACGASPLAGPVAARALPEIRGSSPVRPPPGPPLRLQRCWLSCMLPHLRSQRLRHHSSWCLACTTRARRSCPT